MKLLVEKSFLVDNGFWQGSYTTIWYNPKLDFGILPVDWPGETNDGWIDILGEKVKIVKNEEEILKLLKEK